MIVEVGAALAATLASGLLYAMSARLRPLPAAAWLAPLPLLLLAPRVSLAFTFGAAALAWLAGQSTLWSYQLRELKRPWPRFVLESVGSGVLLGAVVVLTRGYLVEGRVLAAAAAFPVAWAAVEYLVGVRSPHGAWWSIAYTQGDRPAVTQVAALTGVWGVTALITLPASAVAAAAAPAAGVGERLAVLVAAVAVVAATLGYGKRRAARPPGGEAVHVGVAGSPDLPAPAGSPEGVALLKQYADQVRRLADEGARLVVLPEVTFRLLDEHSRDHLEPLARLARERKLTLVVGVAGHAAGQPANLALAFGPGGELATYVKQHLVPGLEDEYQPGRELRYLPGDRSVGVIICKDLDFPELVRAYRRGGARLLLAPAWDFGGDGWLHSRMAVLRGVESGVAVARVARGGRAAISDARGVVVAEAEVNGSTAVSATVRLADRQTVYSRLGNWFAYACVAATTILAVWSVRS